MLVNTGCHTLLEHHTYCCPNCQLPWGPGAARTPVRQAAAPAPHLALMGQSLPGQPQEQTPVGDPHAEVGIKPQLKPRGCVAEEEDPKPSHQLYKLQIKCTRSTRQIMCLWSLRNSTKENTLVLIAVDIGGRKVRIWTAPTIGPEISMVLEGILGRWGGLWLPVRERTLTAVTREKHLLFLCFDLFCRFFWIFFIPFTPSSVVVVDFIGTVKSN